MIWPQATDYNAAVQNPQLCFSDEDLRRGQAVGDLFGLPRPHSGNFADVYQIQSGDGNSWAVKCFTRPVAGLHRRYHAISEHLRQTQRAFMVEFHFLDEGICISGQWYPLVKMRWVEGFRLNEFLREQLHKPAVLDRLAQMWVRLAGELRDADMAHGDLQHGNVLLVPSSKSSSLSLKLIDYDGMYVPALADRPSAEVGHPNYQHPQRLREGGYHRRMDRFAQLLIYTALRCVRSGGEDLWQRYDNMENLLFREEDFRRPSKSRLLRELWDMKDRDTRHLVGHLILASQGPLRVVPALDELVDESGIRPLSSGEEARINDLLDDEVYSLTDNAKPKAAARRATALAAATTVTTVALSDTQPIILEAPTGEPPVSPIAARKSGEVPALSVPRQQRRSFAEIELDAQPPAPADLSGKPLDLAALAEPLVSLLSRPAWLAAFGMLALVVFLIVNVLVWSSVKQPEKTDENSPPPVLDQTEDRLLAPPQPKTSGAPRSETKRSDSSRETPDPVHADRKAPGREDFVRANPNKDRRAAPKDSGQVPDEVLSVHLKDRTPNSLSVEAGDDGELRVFLDRKGFRGNVEIRLENLPDGATAHPVVVPAANDSAVVTIETNEETKKGEHPVKLLVRVNEETLDARALLLNVQPRHGRQELVHFRTIDHAELAGTLYHGWKGKAGMTVLMLHDLHRNRCSLGWRRLAEALQAEGHTVLTFDFRGHGDSKRVSPEFWAYSVNKYLPITAAQKRSNRLKSDHLPTKYVPWLIEDIAAARTYLDLRHDEPDGPVNTFNLVVIGAGQASALGSLWLATEGLRFNADNVGDKIVLKPPEKLSVRQAVWIGMEDPLKLVPFGVHSWLRDAHAKPEVPITFIYGEDDADAANLLAAPIREKLGKELVLHKTALSGQELVDDDAGTAARIQRYLVKTLQRIPPVGWVPRKIKKLRSYWALPVSQPPGMRFFVTAKLPGQEVLSAVPMRQMGIPVDGSPEVSGVLQKLSQP